MSKSYHVTRKILAGKTKEELDEMINEPDDLLMALLRKRAVKRNTKKKRKALKDQQEQSEGDSKS